MNPFGPQPLPQDFEYEAIAATDINAFNELINSMAQKGWSQNSDMSVTPHQDKDGYGMQYSVLMMRVKQGVAENARQQNAREPITQPQT